MNGEPVNSIAPLKNVARLSELVERLVHRRPNLPGLAMFFGSSGLGKSVSATYSSNKSRAFSVQCKSVWTRKKLSTAILFEMGIPPAATVADMVDQIGQELTHSRRPLIIDEADFLISKGLIEIVRDIYESAAGASIVLIGEEQLPRKIKAWERIDGRMLDRVAAQPVTIEDSRILARLYCPRIEVADPVIQSIHQGAHGSVRRVCVELDRVREVAETRGLARISAADLDEVA